MSEFPSLWCSALREEHQTPYVWIVLSCLTPVRARTRLSFATGKKATSISCHGWYFRVCAALLMTPSACVDIPDDDQNDPSSKASSDDTSDESPSEEDDSTMESSDEEDSSDTGGDSSTMESDSTTETSDESSSDEDPDDDFEQFFDPDHIVQIEIELSDEAIEAIQAAGPDGQEYQEGRIRIDGEWVESVGVRLKGRASFQDLDGKAAFKIKFNKFVSGQKFHGLKRLTLNNSVQDQSAMRERLGYEMMRELGVEAPLCNSAWVSVNGEEYGLYANVQSLDSVFVKDHFGEALGFLYDTTNDVYFTDLDRSTDRDQWGEDQEYRFELETREDEEDVMSALTAAIDAVYHEDEEEGWYTASVESLDVDSFLRLAAMQAYIADWDGFFGARNNYKIYQPGESSQMHLLPWGIDQTFGYSGGDYHGPDYCLDGSDSGRRNALLFKRCESHDECWERYVGWLWETGTVMAKFGASDRIDEMTAQIEEWVARDPRSPTDAESWQEAVDDLRDFVHERPEYFAGDLANDARCSSDDEE